MTVREEARPADVVVNLRPSEVTFLERWFTGGLHRLELPSGRAVIIHRQSPTDLIRRQLVSNEDQAAVDEAIRLEGKELPEQLAAAVLRVQRIRAAASVPYLHDGRRFVPVELTAADLDRLDEADAAAIVAAATGADELPPLFADPPAKVSARKHRDVEASATDTRGPGATDG